MRKFRYKTSIGVTEIFKRYKKNTKNPCNLKDSEYTNILRDINIKIIEAMVSENFYFEMPYNLGTHCIVKYEYFPRLKDGKLLTNSIPTDYQESWKLWEELYGTVSDNLQDNLKYWGSIKDKPRVFHENTHTSGYRHKFYWDKTKCKFKNQYFYNAKFTRGSRDILSSSVLKNPFLYFNEIKQ